MKNINFLLLLLGLIFVSACTKDTDNIPPFVSITSTSRLATQGDVCGTNSNILELDSGELLEVSVRFTDETALSQCTVRVANNFSCNVGKTSTITWSFEDIVPISGTDISPTIPISIPANASAGDYRLTIEIADETGNASNIAFRNIKLQQPDDRSAPILTLSNPATNSLSVTKGGILNFMGEMTDNNLLGDCQVGGLMLQYEDPTDGSMVLLNAINLDAGNIAKTFNFDFNYQIPTDWLSATYNFRLTGHDEVHNASETINFEVTVTD